jgi:hypothetical protein
MHVVNSEIKRLALRRHLEGGLPFTAPVLTALMATPAEGQGTVQWMVDDLLRPSTVLQTRRLPTGGYALRPVRNGYKGG